MSIDQLRREFMEKMDKLWTNQFDRAFKKIPQGHAYAYKRYADFLDDFFVFYWRFFDELNKGAGYERLTHVSGKMYEESTRKLEKVWLVTTDAQLEKAAELRRKRKHRRASLRFSSKYQKASSLLKELRGIDMIEKRFIKYRQAAKLLAEFNKKVGKSK
jgi:hypothetical protein